MGRTISQPAKFHARWGADGERLRWYYPCARGIEVGALDLFLADGLAYAQRLVAAGVPVEVDVYPRCIHAFNMVPSRATAAYGRDLKKALTRLPGS